MRESRGKKSRRVLDRPAAVAFGTVLREMRLRRGLSRQTLAISSGVPPLLIAGIERGDLEPTIVTLFRLAEALDVSASDLVSRMEALLPP